MRIGLALVASCVTICGFLSNPAGAEDPDGKFLAGDWTCTACPDSGLPETLTVKWQGGALWFPTGKDQFVKGAYDAIARQVRLQSWSDPGGASPGDVSTDVTPLVIQWSNHTRWQKSK